MYPVSTIDSSKPGSLRLTPDHLVYVILPHKVTPSEDHQEITMEVGRMAAQGGHVLSIMRVRLATIFNDIPVTTIHLSVRNSRELLKVRNELSNVTKVYEFLDHNPLFYQTERGVRTAICTTPVKRDLVAEALGHLPLFAEGL